VNLAQLSVGTKVFLASGDRAEVVTLNAEAETVCIRYLDALAEPELVGTEVCLSADEILAIDMGTHAEGRT
jgi:soluble P-type ATPase